MKTKKRFKEKALALLLVFTFVLGQITMPNFAYAEESNEDITYRFSTELNEDKTVEKISIEASPNNANVEITSIILPNGEEIEATQGNYEALENGMLDFIINYTLSKEVIIETQPEQPEVTLYSLEATEDSEEDGGSTEELVPEEAPQPEYETVIEKEEKQLVASYEVSQLILEDELVEEKLELVDIKTTPVEAFTLRGSQIQYYNRDIGGLDVVIPATINGVKITGIMDGAFQGNTNFPEKYLTSVVIPEGITTIGKYAFRNNNITNLQLPDSIRDIKWEAFNNAGIETLKLPNGITEISGGETFANNKIKNLVISDSLVSTGNSTFVNNHIETIQWGASLKTIGSGAFSNNKLKSINIPSPIETINNGAFLKNQLESVTIGDSVKTIGYVAFKGQDGNSINGNIISSLDLGNSVESIENEAFGSNPIKNLTIPPSLKNANRGFLGQTTMGYLEVDPTANPLTNYGYSRTINHGLLKPYVQIIEQGQREFFINLAEAFPGIDPAKVKIEKITTIYSSTSRFEYEYDSNTGNLKILAADGDKFPSKILLYYDYMVDGTSVYKVDGMQINFCYDLKVTWKDDEGKIILEERVLRPLGERITVNPPPEPTKPGYSVKFWASEPSYNGGYPMFSIEWDTTFTGSYTANDYNIAYDLGYDTSEAIPEKTGVKWRDTNIIPEQEPTRNGYDFLGWYYNSKKAEKTDSLSSMSVRDPGNGGTIKLVAKWQEREKLKVQFLDFDGTVLKEELLKLGENATAPANPTRKGYTFDGWDKKFTNVQSDLYVNAKYIAKKYNVHYTTNNGTNIVSKEVVFDEKTLIPTEELTRTGYTFLNWQYNNTPISNEETYAQLVGDNDNTTEITLVANWKAKEYTVNYDYNDGIGTEISKIVAFEDKNLLPTEPTRIGYKFLGWQEEISGETVDNNVAYKTLVANENVNSITLVAQWQERTDYTVEYNTDGGGTIPNKTGIKFNGSNLLPTSNPIKAGHIFEHWEYNGLVIDNIKTYAELVNNNDKITKATLKATWKERTDYQVVYNTNGGNEIAPKTGVKFTQSGLIPAEPTRAGYIFTGWKYGEKTVAANTKYSELANNDTVLSITLDAQWITKTGYLVKYDYNGGIGTEINKVVKFDEKNLLPTESTKVGYTFTGWKIGKLAVDNNTTYSQLVGGNEDTSEAIIIAQWEEKSNYTVKYNTNGGNEIAPKTGVKFTQNNLLPATNPTKTGYTFKGFTYAGKSITNDTTYAMLVNNIDTTLEITLDAVWEIKKYTVAYDTDGGELIADKQNVEYFHANLLPTNEPTKIGYRFLGWYVGTEKIENVTTYAQISKDDSVAKITLKAKWQEKEYTVKYNTNGGSTIADKTGVKFTDAGLLPVSIPVKEGYKFKGFTYGGKLVLDTTTYAELALLDSISNITLDAVWELRKYTVAYDTNGGNAIEDKENIEYFHNNLLPIVEPIKTGSEFLGWYIGSEKIETTTTYAQIAKDDKVTKITLKAKWQEKEYTVKYNTDGGNKIPNKTGIKFANADLLPKEPIKAGYTFKGFKYGERDVTSTTTYASLVDNNDASSEITLVAKWEEKSEYTVKYNTNGGNTINDKTSIKFTQSSLLAPNPIKTGYTFKHWAYDGKEVLSTSTYGELVKNDDSILEITLNAIWEERNDYTVKYDTNGGIGTIADKTDIKFAEDSLLPETNPTKAGHTFAGWKFAGNLVEPTTTYSTLANNDDTILEITLVAQWEVLSNYTVKYNTNGGSIVEDKINVAFTADNLLPATPTKAGYVLTGWKYGSKTVTNTTRYEELVNKDDIILEVTLDAQWASKSSYTVQYNYNGGIGTDTHKEVLFDGTNLLPEEPIRMGYTFVGWKKDTLDIDNNTTFSQLVGNNEDITNVEIVAQWIVKSNYTVKYNTNGGNIIADKTNVAFTEDNLLPTAPTKTGYTFIGWKNGSKDITSTTTYLDIVNNNDTILEATLNAVWEERTDYMVKYNTAGGGTIPDKTGVRFAQKGLLPSNPEKAGYTFKGWSFNGKEIKSITAYSEIVDNNDATTEVTLIARWEEKGNYTVEYNTNGGNEFPNKTNVKFTQNDLLPANPIKAGYLFEGWTHNGAEVNSATTYANLTNNDDTILKIELVANWEERTDYLVKYNTNGGNLIPDKTGISFLSKNLLPTEPIKIGYTFKGWKYADIDVTSNTTYASLVNNDDTITEIILIANWEEKSNYTVEYNTSGGNNISSKTNVKFTQSDLLPATNPVKEGYTFTGWRYNGVEVISTTTYTELVNNVDTILKIELIAQWNKRNDYKVHYNTDGGSNIESKLNVEFDEQNLLPATNPVKLGFTFKGWVDAENNEITNNTAYTNLTQGDDTITEVTLKSMWEENDYKVNYNAGEGEFLEPAIIKQISRTFKFNSNNLLLIGNPKRIGFIFDGWEYEGKTLSQEDTYAQLVNNNDQIFEIEINAKWITIVDYSVTYNTDGGSFISPKTGLKFAENNLLPAEIPTKSGYIFKNWVFEQVDADGTITEIEATDDTKYSLIANNDDTIKEIMLKAKYEYLLVVMNQAPIIDGVIDSTINYGAVFNPKDGIIVTDKEDGEAIKNNLQITIVDKNGNVLDTPINTRKAGKYTITYKVTDSGGATTIKTKTLTIRQEETTTTTEETTESTTAKPEETTAKPEETTAKPEETTVKPEETTAKPEETTVKPEETTAKPEETTVKPEVSTEATTSEQNPNPTLPPIDGGNNGGGTTGPIIGGNNNITIVDEGIAKEIIDNIERIITEEAFIEGITEEMLQDAINKGRYITENKKTKKPSFGNKQESLLYLLLGALIILIIIYIAKLQIFYRDKKDIYEEEKDIEIL